MERFRAPKRNKEANRPNEYLESTIATLENLLLNIEDPFLRQILEAVIEKINLKKTISDIVKYRDDTSVYQKVKQLGIFFFIDSRSKYNWGEPNSDFFLTEGESFIDIHLPPIKPEERRNLRTKAEKSFQLLAEYIIEHNLKPKYILGVSYEKLSNLAKYFGFKVIEIPIPEKIREAVEKVYQKLIETEYIARNKQPRPMGKILLCYMTKENFLERFGKKS